MTHSIELQLESLKSEVDVLVGATLDTPLDSLPQWDSLAVLLVISHFEHVHKIALSGAQVRGCRNLRDLFKYTSS